MSLIKNVIMILKTCKCIKSVCLYVNESGTPFSSSSPSRLLSLSWSELCRQSRFTTVEVRLRSL